MPIEVFTPANLACQDYASNEEDDQLPQAKKLSGVSQKLVAFISGQ